MRTGIGCLLLLLSAVSSFSSCRQAPAPLPVVRLSHAPHDHHAPLYVAAMKPRHFQENGGLYLREIEVRREYELVSGNRPVARVLISSSTGGKELIRKLTEGHSDVTFGGVPAMLKFIDKDAPIRIISPVMAEGAGLVLGSGLPPRSWEEFTGWVREREAPVRIGYKIETSVQNLIFERALREVGLSYSRDLGDRSGKVVLLNMHGPKNLIPALKGGLLDGFVVNQPFMALAEHQGVGRTVAMLSDLPPEGKWKNNPCCALAVSADFLDAHRPVVQELVTLLMRAGSYIGTAPAESAGLVARWLELETEVEKISLPSIRFTADLNEDWQRGLDFWIETMIASDSLNAKVKRTFAAGTHRELIYDLDLYRRAKNRM